MLTRLRVRNFKTLEQIDIPLGSNVVLVGPNNSGKTTALQALVLWQTGLQEWLARRANGSQAEQRVGVTVNRRSLTHTPVADTRLLWRDLRVSSSRQSGGSSQNSKTFLDIILDGETAGQSWSFGLEFYHANSESIYCRPLRLSDDKEPDRMPLPEQASQVQLALLPPMSGLASEEPEVQPGRIAVLLGEGRTAEVLRNLCMEVYEQKRQAWTEVQNGIKQIFGAELGNPERDRIRGSIDLQYHQRNIKLDLASAGRGMQQTLLLLAHLYANSGSTLLLDEPDAHLEILRQRQIYTLLTETARQTGSQIIAASHSEIILNEAADKDVVIAFVGKPHRIDDRGSQVLKALKEIGFDQYYQAEIKGFILYLEGATDLAILRGYANAIKHPVAEALDNVFAHYVGNQPRKVQEHFFGLREAKPDLKGFAVFDRLERPLPADFTIPHKMWERREIENYLTKPDILLRFAEGMEPEDLVGQALKAQRREAMVEAIQQVEKALEVLGRDPWGPDSKVSEDFLPAVFSRYFQVLNGDNRLNKSDYHVLTDALRPEDIDPEVVNCLDRILEEIKKASPEA